MLLLSSIQYNHHGSFACFGVARECAANKCANVRSTESIPRHCAQHLYIRDSVFYISLFPTPKVKPLLKSCKVKLSLMSFAPLRQRSCAGEICCHWSKLPLINLDIFSSGRFFLSKKIRPGCNKNGEWNKEFYELSFNRNNPEG